MKLTIEVQGIEALQRRLSQVPRQARYAGARALNDAAFKLRSEWIAEMSRVFDRPTPYVMKGVFVDKATTEKLQAKVGPIYLGGKGVEPAQVLLAEVFGGTRRPKRFEVALRRKGLLPNNMAAVPATWLLADPAAGDGHGGIKGSFIVRMLASLQAFGEQGYRSNMTDKGRAKLSGRGRIINERFHGAHTKKGSSGVGKMGFRPGGVSYFISRGKAEYTGRGSWKNGQEQHLAAGIWQRSGIYGADVKPVFLFTRMPRYAVRLQLGPLKERAMAVHFPPAFAAQFRRAMESAR